MLFREGDMDLEKAAAVGSPSDTTREQVRAHLEQTLRMLVSFPEDVVVNFTIGERTTIYKVHCSRRVCGQIIGNHGRTINSVRQMVLAMTARQGIRSIVELPWFPRGTEAT